MHISTSVCYDYITMNYIVANPTGNITVLVTDPVDMKDRNEVTRAMFEAVPTCEQVGYVVAPLSANADVRLEMMGGEFCGNASLSTAAYYVMKNGLLDRENMTNETSPCHVLMECSGVEEPFECVITRLDTMEDTGTVPMFTGTLAMPAPVKIEYADGHPVVFLPGIAHMIVPADRFTRRQIENNIKDYAARYDVDAFGVLRWDESKQFMEPCVYVKGFETLIWEHGCATGSTCLGYWRYKSAGQTMTEVNQPGGMIKIENKDDKIFLTGGVIF